MRDPDYQGRARAWKMEIGEPARKDQEASLVGYIINGPFHPWWSWWMVSVIHLRDIEGVKQANKQYPEAEYEIICLSLDPDLPPDVDKPFPQDIRYLTPPDWSFQFDGLTDEQAIEICDLVARTIAKGQSCDSDYRSWWMESLKTTVEHYKSGMHNHGGNN